MAAATITSQMVIASGAANLGSLGSYHHPPRPARFISWSSPKCSAMPQSSTELSHWNFWLSRKGCAERSCMWMWLFRHFFLYRFNPLLLRFSDGIHQELNLPLAIRECIEENLLTMRPSAHWACLFIPKIRQCKSVFWNKQNQSWAGMNISQITPWLHQQLAGCSIRKFPGNIKCRKILCGEHLLSASTFDSDRNSRRSLNSTGRDESASFRILAKKLT